MPVLLAVAAALIAIIAGAWLYFGGRTMPIFIAAAAATLAGTPANIDKVIHDAPAGSTIVLAPGEYGKIRIRGKEWAKPVTLEMKDGARATLEVVGSKGIRVKGGTFGSIDKGYAIHVRQSQDVGFYGVKVADAPRGMVIAQSQHVTVTKADIVNMKIDGINIGSSQHVTVTDSTCRDFDTGEMHPDCIQLWSSPKRGVTQDVTLLRNRSDGNMQGFTAFNHVRNGVNDGGFDRVTMRDNWVRAYRVNGVAVYDCRDCNISNNTAVTPKDAERHVVVRVFRCTDCTVENNVDGERPKRK